MSDQVPGTFSEDCITKAAPHSPSGAWPEGFLESAWHLKPTKGTYVLVLRLEGPKKITVGKLGTFAFPAGYYLYVGSALGPGGLEARLARHRRRDKKLHWHVDYLLEQAQLVGVLSVASTDRLECLWAQAARQLPGSEIPVPGFGSSDCRCPSHLIYLT